MTYYSKEMIHFYLTLRCSLTPGSAGGFVAIVGDTIFAVAAAFAAQGL
jgi:hypothetical protein